MESRSEAVFAAGDKGVSGREVGADLKERETADVTWDSSGVPHISQLPRDRWLRNVHAGHVIDSHELENMG